MNSSFGEKNKCVANQQFTETSSRFGLSVGIYAGLGAEASVYVDFEAWNNELMAIYDESMSYEGYY